MIQYIMLLMAALVGLALAKRKGRRKFRRYIKGNIDETQLLGTLATKTGIKNDITDNVDDTTWVSSIDAIWSMSNFTNIANAGPIMVGISHSDYTLAEIEEWIELTTGWSQADLRSKEISQRKIRRVGIFGYRGTGGTPADFQYLNDGKLVHTKCGFMIAEGQTVGLWYYNMGSAALATTDPSVLTQGHANLWPQ